MRSAFIVSAVRVPTGKFLGTLKDFAAPELGAMVVREAVARAGIDPAIVDECIMGNVVSGGVGQAPARPTSSPPRPTRSPLLTRSTGSVSCRESSTISRVATIL